MTIHELTFKLQYIQASFQPGGEGTMSVMRAACFGALAEVKTRIHEQGKAVDGSDIGRYNTSNPLYVNPDNSPLSFTPLGKNQTSAKLKSGFGRFSVKTHKEVKVSVKENDKERKTKYFGSYSDFKSFIGRNELGKVNLFLFGGLSSQLKVLDLPNGKFGLGWVPGEAVEGNKGKSKFSFYGRAMALETKYGKKIWGINGNEKQLVIDSAQEAANDFIKKII